MSYRFTTYAQNFEDVMLWRALKDVSDGFYIDLGAQDPVTDSVSLAFYERGWRGIHVEPVAHYAEMLREHRPDDTIIQAAIAPKPGILSLFEIANMGISTADPIIAQQHRDRGYVTKEVQVPCITLHSVFELCQDKEVHWMKIDVEGFERQLLESWEDSKVRPWIVVIESTIPFTQIECHQEWEHLILEKNYEFIRFDGLNRFYISREHLELKKAFELPPNLTDYFSINGTASNVFAEVLHERHEKEIESLLIENKNQLLSKEEQLQSKEEQLQTEIAKTQSALSELKILRDQLSTLIWAQAERERAIAAKRLTVRGVLRWLGRRIYRLGFRQVLTAARKIWSLRQWLAPHRIIKHRFYLKALRSHLTNRRKPEADGGPSLATPDISLGPFKFIPHDGGFFSNFNFLAGEMYLGRRVYPLFSVQEQSRHKAALKHFAYLHPDCENAWFEFFEPIRYDDADELHRQTGFLSGLPDTWGHIAGPEYRIPAATMQLYAREDFPDWRRAVHAEIAHRFRPSADIRAMIDTMLARMPGRRIGVHVRHPSHLVEQGDIFLSDYFEIIDRIRAEHPESSLFLATDNDLAIAAFRHRYGDSLIFYPGFIRQSIDDVLEWAYALVRSSSDEMGFVGGVGFQTHYKLAASGAGNDGLRAGKEAVCDVFTLAACDDFVCTASNFTLTCAFMNPEQIQHLVSKGSH